MIRTRRLAPLALLACLVLAGTGRADDTPAAVTTENPRFDVLVFSKTAGFRHGSIPNGIEAVRRLGREHDFTVEATEDAAAFTDENLRRFEVVVFLNTTGDVLDADQQSAFQRYIQRGGGYAGVHSASDTEYDWPWYGKLVGAYFKGHPRVQPATVHVTDRTHPSTHHLAEKWQRRDEWYDFNASPRGGVRILARLDESTYEGGKMGDDHPIAWYHAFDGGRAWYTGGGHTKEAYDEPDFQKHLLGGIEWSAGVKDVSASASAEAEKTGTGDRDGGD